MDMQEAVKSGFEHYVNFKGRASVAAYWWWFLFTVIVGFVAGFIDGLIGAGYAFGTIVNIALLLPSLSVFIRRLHDTGRTGWWALGIFILSFILIGIFIWIFFMCQKSDEGSNEYGPNPKGGVSEPAGA